MRIGSIEVQEPIPELRRPHVIASLRPWIDAGSVGSLSLARLERHLGAKDLASLTTPGKFFDFTRYRPVVYYVDGKRKMTIPNTLIRYALGQGDHDFILLHLLEPHSASEEYIDSMAALFEHFKVEQYCRIGGMYDAVPHTRPLIVTGSLDGEELTGVPGVTPPRRSPYQGPTSIVNLLSDRARDMGVDNLSLMVRLPQYVQLDEDYTGSARLLGVLSHIYDLPKELSVSRRGTRQYERVSAEMERNTGVKALVEQLESDYDSSMDSSLEGEGPSEDDPPPLSPSVEKFLKELGENLS